VLGLLLALASAAKAQTQAGQTQAGQTQAGQTQAGQTQATQAPQPAKPAAPSSPFDYERPRITVTGALPDLARMDFNQMAALLYAHLLADAEPSRSALIIEAALQRAGKPCQQVSAFQIYRYRTGSRTLKVKCPSKPLFAVTVGATGGFQISGGDGTIPELKNADGRIYSLFGREIIVPKQVDPPALAPGATPASIPVAPPPAQDMAQASTSAPASGDSPVPAPAAPAAEPAEDSEKMRFRSWLLVINGIGLGIILVSLWAYLRSRRRRQEVFDWGLSSDDKDLLLEESREIYPNIYQHPQGFFISRGRQGKRRLFRSALSAILYRDFGLKISEISI
jgi:hypothetical protein